MECRKTKTSCKQSNEPIRALTKNMQLALSDGKSVQVSHDGASSSINCILQLLLNFPNKSGLQTNNGQCLAKGITEIMSGGGVKINTYGIRTSELYVYKLKTKKK